MEYGSDGKESACKAGDWDSIPGLGRFPGEGNGNPYQYSCLANPSDRGGWQAGRLQFMGLQRVGHASVTNTHTHTHLSCKTCLRSNHSLILYILLFSFKLIFQRKSPTQNLTGALFEDESKLIKVIL